MSDNPASKHAARVERAAHDPERIERRKGITPAFTVPRYRATPAPTVEYRIEWFGTLQVHQPVRPKK